MQMKKIVLLKYGELVLKGLNRSYFDNLLLRRVRALLKAMGGTYETDYAQDALADRTDEGRLRLRYASGSRQQGFDPRISEWGNPPTVMGRYRLRPGGTQGSETSQYLQERIFRE